MENKENAGSPIGEMKAYTLEEVATASGKPLDEVRRLAEQSVIGGPILNALGALDAGDNEAAKQYLVAALQATEVVFAGRDLCLLPLGVGLAP